MACSQVISSDWGGRCGAGAGLCLTFDDALNLRMLHVRFLRRHALSNFEYISGCFSETACHSFSTW